jgi:hypothetical protein
MGKVEMKLYKAHLSLQPSGPPNCGRLCGSQATVLGISATAAKHVLADQGATVRIRKDVRPSKYYSGELLQTITLHFCTVPSLIQVGILPKPPNIYLPNYNWKAARCNSSTPGPCATNFF